MIEVHAVTLRVDALARRGQVADQRGRDRVLGEGHGVELDGPGAELQQRSGLELHVPDEPHDQGVVSQTEVRQSHDEHQSMGERCQLVVMEVEHAESGQAGQSVRELAEVVVTQ